MDTNLTIDDLLNKTKGFMESQLILTAHELDLYNHIDKHSLSSKELSRITGSSERGLTILLDALTSLGILIKSKNLYSNTDTTLKYLCKKGSHYKGSTFDHMLRMRDMWTKLPEAVIKGTSPRKKEECLVTNRERNRSFILAMKEIGTPNARIIAENINLSSCRKLLDLGGGPGSYSIELLKKNPLLSAVIIDLPLTLEVAKEVVQAEGMNERIELKEGDFFNNPECDLGKGYDSAIISNVLHIEGEERNRSLLNNVYMAMQPPGIIIIHESIIEESRTKPPDRAIFAVNMLVHTERGNCYSFIELKEWLEEAGFTDVEFVDCFEKPSIIVAYKK